MDKRPRFPDSKREYFNKKQHVNYRRFLVKAQSVSTRKIKFCEGSPPPPECKSIKHTLAVGPVTISCTLPNEIEGFILTCNQNERDCWYKLIYSIFLNPSKLLFLPQSYLKNRKSLKTAVFQTSTPFRSNAFANANWFSTEAAIIK